MQPSMKGWRSRRRRDGGEGRRSELIKDASIYGRDVGRIDRNKKERWGKRGGVKGRMRSGGME